NAYVMLFVAIVSTTLVLVRTRAALAPFLATFYGCYLVGLAAFLVYPVVGPCIYYPESFRADYEQTLTAGLMHGMATEYRAATSGGRLSGLGYFVGIPSLHVAVVIVLQGFLRVSPVHFWVFLPVNVLCAASTVLLGYHYIVDAVGGATLGALALLAHHAWQ